VSSLVRNSDQPQPRLHVAVNPPILSGVEVMRKGRVEPLLHNHPSLSSSSVWWAGVAVEDHSVPACVIPRHEHLENFVHVVLHGSVKYEVLTRGKVFEFAAIPGTTFVLPQGTIDELRWKGATHRIAVAIHPNLLVNALDETAHERNIELTENWNLTDPNIMALLLAMRADLDSGSPAGRLYARAWPTRWLFIYSIATPRTATHRSPIEEACQDIASGACLIILETIWQVISVCRNLLRWPA
jgi:hypothetical protein